MSVQPLSDNEYTTALRGKLVNLLSWSDFDQFWEDVFSNDTQGWYVYQVGEQPPQDTLAAATFTQFCRRLMNKLKREHDEEYCGIVYVDDKQSPTLIKIYDPNNLGVVCGFSDSPPLPGWIISKLKPIDVVALAQAKSKQPRWKKLFKFSW